MLLGSRPGERIDKPEILLNTRVFEMAAKLRLSVFADSLCRAKLTPGGISSPAKTKLPHCHQRISKRHRLSDDERASTRKDQTITNATEVDY